MAEMNVLSCERCRREDLMGAEVGLWAGADPAHSAVLAAAEGRGRLCGLCATTTQPAVFDVRVRPAAASAGPRHLRVGHSVGHSENVVVRTSSTPRHRRAGNQQFAF
jgi:hypothetical protein